ncbi:MAG: KpsF/GutQ family sugar-phosphate isomerase [Proteobacteria bacterium]|nr:KpsF/GutQ family sugar-phosphate isomerase [Pseudomonadota bacterium]
MTRPSPPRAAPAAAPAPDIAVARRVLALEATGIEAVSRALDASFVRALDAIAGIKGRVIVTGMGKSGHVARKVAATLASTGTPAFFVHPAEASHGDLGMITRADLVMMLSSSGETPELSDLVAYCRRHGIPIIALTRRKASTLAQNAAVTLVMPESEEACTLGLAPTTSTTAMLALGDAIAVALLERNGFSAAEFNLFHPGGQLGRRLLKVGDLMHGGEEMPLVSPEAAMSEAILVMTAKRFGCVGVADGEGRLVGIVTDGDLRRHMAPTLLARRAGEVMTRGPKTASPGMLAAEAVAIMNARAITNLFVVEGERPIGILHIHDCLRAGVV